VVNAQVDIGITRLRRFEFFALLKDQELASIARCCSQAAFTAGSMVIRQGEVARRVYFLEDGAVNIYREKMGRLHKVALIECPGVFGEMALVNREHVRTASVRAATDLHVLSLPFSDMIAALRRFPALQQQLRELLHERGLGQEAQGPARNEVTHQQDVGSVTAKIAALCREH
jgi:CRP-like cAMP-binding protein